MSETERTEESMANSAYVAYFNGNALVPAIPDLPDGWYGITEEMLRNFGPKSIAALNRLKHQAQSDSMERELAKALGLGSYKDATG